MRILLTDILFTLRSHRNSFRTSRIIQLRSPIHNRQIQVCVICEALVLVDIPLLPSLTPEIALNLLNFALEAVVTRSSLVQTSPSHIEASL